MTEATSRLVRLHRDGTVTVTLRPEEVPLYAGPRTRDVARFRCQVVSTDDLHAELTGAAETLPWLRHVDRTRALRELHASGAHRAVLAHVGSTPVAAFGPTHWCVVEVLRGRWESGDPFRSDQLCAGGGMVFDAALPLTLSEDAVRTGLRSVPRDDPRRRERVAILLGGHDDGLSADIGSGDRRPATP